MLEASVLTLILRPLFPAPIDLDRTGFCSADVAFERTNMRPLFGEEAFIDSG